MATRIPLVMNAGQIQQLQSSDSLPSGAGGSYDGLSTLVNSVNAITSAATLVLNTLNKFTGTSANYAGTFPTATGNAGKIIDVRGGTSAELTKVIALTPASGESIDYRAANAPVYLLANEYARFYCDGTQWWTVFHRFGGWNSFTPTINGAVTNPTKNATNKSTCQWRRIADDLMKLYWDFGQNGAGTAGSGDYLFIVPNGATIDTTIIDVGAQNTYAGQVTYLGIGFALQYGVAISNCLVFGASSTALSMMDGTSTTHIGSGLKAMNTAIQYSFQCDLPIATWG